MLTTIQVLTLAHALALHRRDERVAQADLLRVVEPGRVHARASSGVPDAAPAAPVLPSPTATAIVPVSASAPAILRLRARSLVVRRSIYSSSEPALDPLILRSALN